MSYTSKQLFLNLIHCYNSMRPYLSCLDIFMIRWWWTNSWCKQLIDFDSYIKTEIFWAWSTYNGNTFIKWQLEILPVDKHYRLSTPLHWIPKISLIPTVCNICKIKPPIVYPRVIALFSTTTENNRIWIINFCVKFETSS